MAKQYSFRISANKAEFSYTDGVRFNTLVIGDSNTRYYNMQFDGTLTEGLAELARVSASINLDHYASLGMFYSNDRKPAGFDKADTRIWKQAEETPVVIGNDEPEAQSLAEALGE